MKLKTAFISSQIALLISFFVVLISGAIIYHNVTNHYQVTQTLNDYKQILSDTINLQHEFTLDRDEQMQDWSTEQFADFSQIHFELLQLVKHNEIAERLLMQIQEAVRNFEQNLRLQLSIQKKLGFDEDQGIRGNFRNSIHAIQNVSQQINDQKLELLILELRRREKDYLLRWKPKYLELHKEILVELKVYLQTHDNPSKEELLTYLKEYDVNFTQYTAFLEQIGQASAKGLAGKNKLLSQVINERYTNLSLYLNKQSIDSSKETLILTFSITFIFLALSLAGSFFINKRIGYGLFKLNSFITAICQSDSFSMRTNLRGDDEVTDLAKNIDKLLTHIEELINRLNLAQKRLIEDAKMASLGSMVKGFAHELNTPLGIAITSESHLREQVEHLKQAFDQGTLQKNTLQQMISDADNCLSLMESNLNRSASLINSFKQVASHQEYDELVEFNVETFLTNLFSSLKHELEKYDVAYSIDVTNGLVVRSYLGAFNQIFTILIINSLRHGARDNEKLNIEIVAKMVGASLHFRYIDDGVGVKEDLLDKIFEPFVTTKRAKGGTGLGLSIVYNLVTQRLNGEIEFQSIEGDGVCIYLHFDEVDYSLKFEE
ncbi:sensor histidine kinase [Pseudoalteromonas sp. G4]|uniref:sensor histidine kinase n=1 Tax=Pseudoalteromonas sp. G4 TaxID=2992761 RepID=UPI00237E0B7D|nr:HAMP domain-containing sensor histidine kinase [Pseudoalteromonas sp. G4]MDE3271925.1 HAMP domain-containing histidine kinase [Pseudoalteromonas sp. G4]